MWQARLPRQLGSLTPPSGPVVPPAGRSGDLSDLCLLPTAILFLQGNQDQRSLNFFHFPTNSIPGDRFLLGF